MADSFFEEIKRNLDPVFGYMIFEGPLQDSGSGPFREVPGLLSRAAKGILEHKLYHDEAGGGSPILWSSWTWRK